MTPNGVFYLQWQNGQPGVGVIRAGRGSVGRQATRIHFSVAPVSAPMAGADRHRLEGKARAALVYAPITVTLPDVVNAWQFSGNACQEQLLIKNAERSFLRAASCTRSTTATGTETVPSLPSSSRRTCSGRTSARRSMACSSSSNDVTQRSAFWSFVDAANKSMSTSMSNDVRNSQWADVFAALARRAPGCDDGRSRAHRERYGRAVRDHRR